jgi:hypothetical protein
MYVELFDRQHNLYICPHGKFLRTTGTVHDGRTIIYRVNTRDCGPCPAKPKCTPNMTFQKIPRGVHDDAQKSVASFFGVAYEVIDYIKGIHACPQMSSRQ